MDNEHRWAVQQRFPAASGKTFLLGQWENVEIADPIHKPISAFELAWQQINAGVLQWITRLKQAGMLHQVAEHE
ncbi:hypothetical protein GCM10023144_25080 [Pigmentiphaga soli]|uniref:Protein-tyrosine-phosphatase n=2 Tax=Pigmentiphaga soli TaxID=1007095 RepID=A0ABP8H3G0_9BURK